MHGPHPCRHLLAERGHPAGQKAAVPLQRAQMHVVLPAHNLPGFIDKGDADGRRAGGGNIHEHPGDAPGVRHGHHFGLGMVARLPSKMQGRRCPAAIAMLPCGARDLTLIKANIARALG
jgi:hypothetical protein